MGAPWRKGVTQQAAEQRVLPRRLIARSRSEHACWVQQQQVQQQPGAPTLLDVVVSQRAAVLQLLARKDEALLVGRNALLVLWGRRQLQAGWVYFYERCSTVPQLSGLRRRSAGGSQALARCTADEPLAHRRRQATVAAAGPGTAPGSWPSHSRWCRWTPPPA